MIEVVKPGFSTTVQDLGRMGYQRYGMVVGGAVDLYSLKVGNLLVGNLEEDASLEVTIGGIHLKAAQKMRIAVTGGGTCYLDGKQIPMWRSVTWEKESLLCIDGCSYGLRAYLSVCGGIDVPYLMGSRSTYVPADIGGFKGRPLKKGDFLHIGKRKTPRHHRVLPPQYIPCYSEKKCIRVLLGPHYYSFTKKGLDTFLHSEYQVTHEVNRMGMKVWGEKIEHVNNADILPQAVTFGTIQVPHNGQPMIMLSDRQTTGGYTQIATVIGRDHSLVAQSRPNDILYFRVVSLEEAQHLLKIQDDYLLALRHS